MSSQPFWKTRTRRRFTPVDESIQDVPSSSSSHIQPDSTAKHVSGSDNADKKLHSNLEDGRLLIKQLEEKYCRSAVSLVTEGPPQKDGFISLFIEVCCWQSDWRPVNARRRGQRSPFAGRVGYQRPLDTVKIGEGTTFAVYRRYDHGSPLGQKPNMVVMKDSKMRFTRNGTVNDKAVLRGLLAEIRVLSQEPLRQHPNIVKLLDVRWDHPNLNREILGPTLYLEFAEIGTLPDFCAANHPDLADQTLIRSILINVWDGLCALHQLGIIHGDVKPSNVLLFGNVTAITAKISDFGCAIFLSEQTADKVELLGRSPPWDAPEAGSEIEVRLLSKTDIYSYGLLYWWLRLGGRDPFCLDSEDPKPFGLSGSYASKLDTLKKLKQTRDLDKDMLQSVMSMRKQDSSLDDLHDEIELMGLLSLRKNPEERTLGSASHPFNTTFMLPSPQRGTSNKRCWTLESAWVLPLRLDPDEAIPSTRLVETLKIFSSDEIGSTAEKAAVNILLFRCHLEGFGVPQNYILAARYLQDAAELGHPHAQAVVKTFFDVVNIELPPAKAIEYCIAKINPSISDLATEYNALGLFSSMISREECLRELQTDNTTQGLAVLENRFIGQKMPLIHYVAARGWADVMNLIIDSIQPGDRDSQFSLQDPDGYTPLIYSCEYGHASMTMLLLERCPFSVTVLGKAAPPPLFLLYNLNRPSLKQENGGKSTFLGTLTRRLVGAGADPNQTIGTDIREALILGRTTFTAIETLRFNQFKNPLSYAIWIGDLETVQCLLDVGARPDIVCLHLATAAHRVDILEILLQCKIAAWPNTESCNLGSTSLLDSALIDSPGFGYSKRLAGTRMTHQASLKQTVRFILDHCINTAYLMSPYMMTSYLIQCCRFNVTEFETLGLLIYPNSCGPYAQSGPELLFTAISWDRISIVKHVLNSNCLREDSHGFSAAHVCATWPVSPMILHLLQENGTDFNSKQNNRASADLETPYQMAVACQNFPVANWLFETRQSSRDDIIASFLDQSESCTLLGWLIRANWSESKKSILYLLEEYDSEPLPGFIVTPTVGRSSLQEAARRSPTNKLSEQDEKDRLHYLISKYPGSRHLEYQRIDDASVVTGDTGHAGTIFTLVDGKPTPMKNTYHFNRPIERYIETKEKLDNGTALHFAVRAINYPAVEALLEAGADASAMIGIPLPDSNAIKFSRGASTYAVKENCWASTVLDFATLVADRFGTESSVATSTSMNNTLVALHQYQKQRIHDIIAILQQKGAANSLTFIRKRKEEILFRERREKGNRAFFRSFKKEVKEGLASARKVYKSTMLEAKEHLSTQVLDPEATKINSANKLLRQGRYEEAMELYLQVQEQFQSQRFYKVNEVYWTLVMNMGITCQEQRKYMEAEKYLIESFTALESLLGDEHHLKLTVMGNLGNLYLSQGKAGEAESWCEKAYSGRKKALGPNDPETLDSLASIGSVRFLQERNTEAETAYEQAFQGLKIQVGQNDSRTLRAMYHLGQIYTRTQRYESARKLLEQAVSGRETTLGLHHVNTLDAVSKLSIVLREQGDSESATKLGLRVLTGYQENLAFDDAKLTDAAYFLGEIYQKEENWDAAISMFQLTLDGEEKRLGRNHQSTLVTVTKLASTYRSQGEYKKSIQMEIKALGGYQEQSGPENVDVTNTAYRLGEMYLKLEQYSEAISMLQLALSGEESRLGRDHTSTLLTVTKLAATYAAQDLTQKAIELETKALSGYRNSLSSSDVRVTNTAYRLGGLHYKLDQWNQAISMYRLALDGEETRLGHDDPATLLTIRQLAHVYTSQGSAHEAIKLRIRVLESRDRGTVIDDKIYLDNLWNLGVNYRITDLTTSRSFYKRATEGYEIMLGTDHRETLDGYLRLGDVSLDMKDLFSAELYYRKAVEGLAKTTGSEHQDTLNAMEQLASVLYQMGKYQEGINILENVLKAKGKTLGPSHSSTVKTGKNLEHGQSLVERKSHRHPSLIADSSLVPPLSMIAQSVAAMPPPQNLHSQMISSTPSFASSEVKDEWIDKLVGGMAQSSPVDDSGHSSLVVSWSQEALEEMILGGKLAESTDSEGLTPLLWAVGNGCDEISLLLIQMGADCNRMDQHRRTPLHLASQSNRLEMPSILHLPKATYMF